MVPPLGRCHSTLTGLSAPLPLYRQLSTQQPPRPPQTHLVLSFLCSQTTSGSHLLLGQNAVHGCSLCRTWVTSTSPPSSPPTPHLSTLLPGLPAFSVLTGQQLPLLRCPVPNVWRGLLTPGRCVPQRSSLWCVRCEVTLPHHVLRPLTFLWAALHHQAYRHLISFTFQVSSRTWGPGTQTVYLVSVSPAHGAEAGTQGWSLDTCLLRSLLSFFPYVEGNKILPMWK